MFHLLKIEWLKVKNYKAFWIFLALYLLGLLSINLIIYQFSYELRKDLPLELFPYGFPKLWQTIGWISSWLIYFPGMLMILLITNEFNYKTHRQNIIDGLSRESFITVKLLVCVILAFIATIMCFLNVLLFGAISGNGFSFGGSEYLLYTFLQSLCYITGAMFLAIVLRRSGLAIIIFFVYGLIFEQLIGNVIDNKVIHGHYFWYYMPFQSSDVLIPVPFAKDIIYKNAPNNTVLIMVTLAYIFIFCFFTFRKFKKEDL